MLSIENKEPNELWGRFSTLNKLVRVTAWCLRFAKNCKQAIVNKIKGNLTREELKESLSVLIKLMQGESFKQDSIDLKGNGMVKNNSRLKSLDPFVDDMSILRVGGRLRNSELNYDTRHPIILDNSHSLTKLQNM